MQWSCFNNDCHSKFVHAIFAESINWCMWNANLFWATICFSCNQLDVAIFWLTVVFGVVSCALHDHWCSGVCTVSGRGLVVVLTCCHHCFEKAHCPIPCSVHACQKPLFQNCCGVEMFCAAWMCREIVEGICACASETKLHCFHGYLMGHGNSKTSLVRNFLSINNELHIFSCHKLFAI